MKKLLAVICTISVLFLSGCSMMSLDGSDIMCPPKATGSNAVIQKLIDKETSGDYVLKYPKNGLTRSSIVMHDLDCDGDEDAVAFYCEKDDDSIHALFVECMENDYVIIEDVVFESSAIDRIDFANLDDKGNDEIIIGYAMKTSSMNSFDVFTFDNKLKRKSTSFTYTSLVTGDFNMDKSDDILLISLYSSDIEAKAQLLVYNNSSLAEIGSVSLDSDVTTLAMASYSKISQSSYGAVIDGVSTTGDYTTQVVYFDSSAPALLNPLYSYSGYNLTRRSTGICSFDFNRDEVVDIPLCSLMPYKENEDINTVCRRIDFANLDTDTYTLNTVKSTIFCPNDGYMITMPQEWEDGVTARYDKATRELNIYSFEYSSNQIKSFKKLLTVKSYFDEDYNKDTDPFSEFARSGSTVYTYSLGANDEYLSITGDELASLFVPVNI